MNAIHKTILVSFAMLLVTACIQYFHGFFFFATGIIQAECLKDADLALFSNFPFL